MKRAENYANDTAAQFALREMHALLNRWTFWFVMAAIVMMLAVSGPFGTLDAMGFAQRFAYWGAIALFTALPSFTIAFMVNCTGWRRAWGMTLRIFIAGALASLPVSMIVWGISAFVAGNSPASLAGFLDIVTRCVPISFGITAIYTLLHRDVSAKRQHTGTDEIHVPFFERLNPDTGRALLTVQAQDHYVEVTTTRGRELVLIRLSDAENELAALDGMRVHRSWWVTRGAVDTLKRANGRLVIRTTDGRTIPVSRGNEKAVREWLN